MRRISPIITPPNNTALVHANTTFIRAKRNHWLTLREYNGCLDHRSHLPLAPLREIGVARANTWYRQSG